MTKHCEMCEILTSKCICNKCANDHGCCCVQTHPDTLCPVTECENFISE